MTETLHRHDPGGPEAVVVCEDGSAVAVWDIPAGQLLQEHPELDTGGYVYFTLDSEPTNTIEQIYGGETRDIAGWDVPEGETMTITLNQVEPDVLYRAHLLLAYEDDGPAWHNDTQFSCSSVLTEITETPISIEVETLPETGLGDSTGLLLVASLLFIGGVALLKKSWPWD